MESMENGEKIELDMPLEARNRAGGNFKEGLNCAESVLKAFNELYDYPMSPDVIKMATGFGGGVGHSGCMCGALTGSIMVLGLFKGRTSATESREPAYDIAKEFHDRFIAENGATCCRVLNRFEFDSPDHLRRCLKLTGGTAKRLMEFIQEKELTL